MGDTGGGWVGAADASLVFPQTLVIHSVSASFSWSLLRYNKGDDTRTEIGRQTHKSCCVLTHSGKSFLFLKQLKRLAHSKLACSQTRII